MKTTFKTIKKHKPCKSGWKNLLESCAPKDLNEEITIRQILESNGIKDAVWALRAVSGHEREIRHFSADVAELALPAFEEKYPGDDRPRKAIKAARDYADGKIGPDELKAAAAYDADAAADAATWAKIENLLLKYI